MKILRQSRLNRYYDLYTDKNTSFERQIMRLEHDPIRYYEGTNENVSIKTIKAVRLG
jgi:hypothetical protein